MSARWLSEAQVEAFQRKRAATGKQSLQVASKPCAEPAPAKPPKYRNRKTECEGILFDSRLEALCWGRLRLLEKMGKIRNLRRQVRFSLFMPGGEHYGIYRADFVYDECRVPISGNWYRMVADAKSSHTRTLQAWKKVKGLMRACHGIDVLELP